MDNFQELLDTMKSKLKYAKLVKLSRPVADRAFYDGADYMHKCFLEAMLVYTQAETDKVLKELSEVIDESN